MKRYKIITLIVVLAIFGVIVFSFNKVNTSEVYNVKDFGATPDDSVDDTESILKAIEKAAKGTGVVYFPSGVYKANIVVNFDNISIKGENAPTYDQVNNSLVNGTVIKGKINCNGKVKCSVTDLGVDATGLSDDGIISGQEMDTEPLYQNFKNLTIIGDGYQAMDHALLLQAGSHIWVENIKMYNFFHGLAIRASYVHAKDIYAYQCGGTSVIVKSALGNEITEDVNINGVVIEGDPTDPFKMGGQVHVQSWDDNTITQNVTINNVVGNNTGEGTILVTQVKGITKNITIMNVESNVSGHDESRAAFDISGASDVIFFNCKSEGAKGYAFRSRDGAKNIKVYNSNANNSFLGDSIGEFNHLELNDEIVN